MQRAPAITALCRDCDWSGLGAPTRCPACASPRVLQHGELGRLGVAHMDCDAFYAAVEKRDRPELADQPVIIGGGRRGVVSTACYVARISGVRSAMPMFKALKLCPEAVVIKPDMTKYVAVSREIRAKMDALTPLVEPLSLDEAFLDLRGAERLHRRAAAETMARLSREIERDVGVTVSIGLAPNKFLAKIASELDKPRGFAVIGAAEAVAFLNDKPVGLIWGVGPKFAATLTRDGFSTIGDLRRAEPDALFARYGAIGARLARLSRGEDARAVTPDAGRKSVSAETTFDEDTRDAERLDGRLWRLSEDVSRRMKAAGLVGRTVTLKVKTADFRTLTRQTAAGAPTDLADAIHRSAAPLLEIMLQREKSAFRLLGVGLSDLSEAGAHGGGVAPRDLFDQAAPRRAEAESAMDSIRNRFGRAAITKGRALKGD